MNSKADELRSRLPLLAAEMHNGISFGTHRIREIINVAKNMEGDQARAWEKGLIDALWQLRGAQDAQRRFEAWTREVVEQEVDHCGLTAEERASVFGPQALSDVERD